jgi:hypothetical protein
LRRRGSLEQLGGIRNIEIVEIDRNLPVFLFNTAVQLLVANLGSVWGGNNRTVRSDR